MCFNHIFIVSLIFFILCGLMPQDAQSARAYQSVGTPGTPPGILHKAAPSPAPSRHPVAQRRSSASSPRSYTTASGSIKLFGTVEFQRPLNTLPGWLDVLKRNGKDPVFVPGKYFNKKTSWEQFRQNASGKSGLELLRYVNVFWNRMPYKEDINNWGRPDYWAIPAEFIKKSGDCEDYAITKYFTLKELGINPDSMRIVVLRDTIRNLAHAVLAVYENGDVYILDNLTDLVMSHRQLTNYQPQYSVNEKGRWTHIKGNS